MNIIKIIKEELLSPQIYKTYGFKTNHRFDIYKNPPSITRMEPDLRAVSTPNNDLYAVDERGFRIIHADILEYLRRYEGYKLKEREFTHPILNNIIGWTRRGRTNYFYLAEGYDYDSQIKPHINYLINHIEKLKNKFPNIKFVPKKITTSPYK